MGEKQSSWARKLPASLAGKPAGLKNRHPPHQRKIGGGAGGNVHVATSLGVNLKLRQSREGGRRPRGTPLGKKEKAPKEEKAPKAKKEKVAKEVKEPKVKKEKKAKKSKK